MSITSKISKILKFYKGLKKVDILIWDDIFPHPISGFRYEEFKEILSEFRNSKIIVHPKSYHLVGSNKSEHVNHVKDLYRKKNSLVGRISQLKRFNNINAKLFYCVFLNNIITNLSWLESHKTPFIFTLYPGGGFQVNSESVDEKLTTVFNSPMFRKVIVTQKFTRDYLIEKSLCIPKDIELIFGCVVPQNSINNNIEEKPFYKKGKDTFDIVFCAAKYTSQGQDKGYDTFIDFAKSISTKYDFVRFHVIGGFDKSVIDVTIIEDLIKFYGYINFDNLSKIYRQMDVIISPNKPFILRPGAFDGFPLGTVVEAALNGVVPVISDALNENNYFEDGEEILIIENTSDSIQENIELLINNPKLIVELAKNSKAKFSHIYNNNFQVEKRLRILAKEFNN